MKLYWIDNNKIEKGFRIYRKSEPFDINTLPEVYQTLSSDTGSYEIENSVIGEYWYMISAFDENDEKFSELFLGTESTTQIHDIFGDNSIIATYNFDNNGDDIGGIYSFTANTFTTNGVVFQALDLKDAVYDTGIDINSLNGNYSFSFWVYIPYQQNDARIIDFSVGSNGSMLLLNGSKIEFIIDRYSVKTYDLNDFVNSNFVHIVMCSNQELYINGVQSTENISDSNKTTSNNTLHLGGYNNTTQTFDGYMDILRVFNRALTPTEVNILYHEGAIHGNN